MHKKRDIDAAIQRQQVLDAARRQEEVDQYSHTMAMEQRQHCDVMRMSVNRREDFEAVGPSQRLLESASRAGQVIASTRLNGSTVGQGYLELAANRVREEFNVHVRFITSIEMDRAVFDKPKSTFFSPNEKTSEFLDIYESIKAVFGENSSNVKKDAIVTDNNTIENSGKPEEKQAGKVLEPSYPINENFIKEL